MASRRIPNVGTRVNLQMFAGDILSHQGLVTVEQYQPDSMSVVFRDGAGVHVGISGDRSSLAMILSAALADLGPESQEPEPPPEEAEHE
jgi:hypothetical protein